MSGPTNESIEIQRQEAYRNGLYEAKDIAWRRYMDSGKVNATALELHDALMRACRLAEDVLRSLRAAAPDVGKAQAPSPEWLATAMQLADDMAEKAYANGIEFVASGEADDAGESQAREALAEHLRAAIAQSAPRPVLLEAGKEEQR
jgi:hypothetical protein